MAKIKLTIDGVDYTSRINEESYSIDDADGPSIDTMDIELWDEDNNINIRRDADFIAEEYVSAGVTTRRFGGIVVEVNKIPDGVSRRISVTAQDWKAILEKSTFVYSSDERMQDTDLIQRIFEAAQVTEFDITSMVNPIRVIDPISFNGQSLHHAISQIAEIAAATWDSDPLKRLIYEVPGTRYAPFSFSDNPQTAFEIQYQNANESQIGGQYNAVEIRGGKMVSGESIEVHSGDGSTREFYTEKVQRAPAGRERVTISVNTGIELDPVWSEQSVTLEGEGYAFDVPIANDVSWNPIHRKVFFKNAPPNLPNAWRIAGQYETNIAAQDQNDFQIRVQGRRYQKVIDNPDIQSNEMAIHLAQAFLRENGPVEHVQLEFYGDEGEYQTALNRLQLGEIVPFTNRILGYDKKPMRLNDISTRILGGTVMGYRILLAAGTGSRGSGTHSFDHLMMEFRRKATQRDRPQRDEEAYYQIRRDAPVAGSRLNSDDHETRDGPYLVGTAVIGEGKVA